MPRISNLALAAFAAFATIGTAHATDASSEQRSAGAIMTAFRIGDEVPSALAVLTYSAKDFTERTLRVLEEATTPAALQRTRTGIIAACPGGGTVKARLSRGNVLEMEWLDCSLDISGFRHVLNGPVEVVLCGDDLTPDYVQALRLGDSRRHVIETFVQNGEPVDPANRISRNLHLVGHITLGRPDVNYNFDGPFAYSLEGFFHQYFKTPVAATGEVFQFNEHRVSASDAYVSGTLEYGDLGWQEDVRLNSGKFSTWIRTGPIGDEPGSIGSSSVRGENLRVHNSGDYMLGTETFIVNGSAWYVYPQGNMDCHSGGYWFATRVPLVHPSEFQSGVDSWNQGELAINGSTTARFSANADPSELGEMHIDVTVRRVGTFGYDGNSLYETALPTVAECTE